MHPGVLKIPDKTPWITALTMRDNYKEEIYIFMQTVDMEKYFNNHFVTTIDNMYLGELGDSQTYTIIMKVAAILYHLFASYGLVDTVENCKGRTKNFPYGSEPEKSSYYCIKCSRGACGFKSSW